METFTISSETFWTRVLVSILCGAVIGFERQIRGKPAGIRTSILICLGTQSFMSVAFFFPGAIPAETARVMGQIVTGIGFLGAGVIMSKENIVKGVTSAAVIWILAGIGVAIGSGMIDIALALTFVTVGVLVGVELLENSFKKLRQGVYAKYHYDLEFPKRSQSKDKTHKEHGPSHK